MITITPELQDAFENYVAASTLSALAIFIMLLAGAAAVIDYLIFTFKERRKNKK